MVFIDNRKAAANGEKYTMRNDVSLGDHGYFHFGGAHLYTRLYLR